MRGPLESPFRAWLDLQCQLIAGTERGLLVLGASERAPGAEALCWPAGEETGPRLSATVESALAQGGLVVQAPDAAASGVASTADLALPVRHDGRVVGAFGVSVRGLPPSEVKSLAGLLGAGVRGLEMVLAARIGQERLASRLGFAGRLLESEHVSEGGHALAAELSRSLGCERVAVGLRIGRRMRVLALSEVLDFNEESRSVRDLLAAMEESVEQDSAIELPRSEDTSHHAGRAHQTLLQGTEAGAIRTVPLAARGRAIGALTCEWRTADCVSPPIREKLGDAAVLCGPILELMGRADAGALSRIVSSLGDWSRRHLGSDRRVARAALAAAALVLLLLAVAPAQYRISARATLEGRVQRALVAGVGGYIAEANARAGDLVKEGQVLARLDDRDLQLERRKRESQIVQLEKEYREALADRDRTQVSILRAQIDQAAAHLGLVDAQLGRTSVTAPFDGIILEGDLDRSLGSPVELGSVLFEIAPLDGYRIIIEVDGRDIADVEQGQRGWLALSALPGTPLPLAIERVTPISSSEEGRSYFRVEAVLEEPSDVLRPGMDGIAKVDVGRRRLLWVWTHELLDWLRLWTWSFLP